jgi:hypothetical protein
MALRACLVFQYELLDGLRFSACEFFDDVVFADKYPVAVVDGNLLQVLRQEAPLPEAISPFSNVSKPICLY